MHFYKHKLVLRPYGASDLRDRKLPRLWGHPIITKSSKEVVCFLLTELFQVVSTIRLGHGCDGHQWTWIPSQSLAENILAEVYLLGVHTFFQDVKVSLEQRRGRSDCYSWNIFDNHNRKQQQSLYSCNSLQAGSTFVHLMCPISGIKWLKRGLFLLARSSGKLNRKQFLHMSAPRISVSEWYWKQEGRADSKPLITKAYKECSCHENRAHPGHYETESCSGARNIKSIVTHRRTVQSTIQGGIRGEENNDLVVIHFPYPTFPFKHSFKTQKDTEME